MLIRSIASLAVLLGASLPAGAFEVGAAPAMRRVLPQDPVPAERSIDLAAARGEWEGFQVVIREAGGLQGVDVAVGDLVGPAGALIPGTAARLYRAVFLDIQMASAGGMLYHERFPGRYPDPLVPLRDPCSGAPAGGPFDLAPGETGLVYADLEVPRSAAPGFYRGNVRVTAAAGLAPVDLALAVEVWPFELPLSRTVATAFGFALHEHRIDPTTVGGPVRFQFDANGTLLPVNWAAYDAAVGPFLESDLLGSAIPVPERDVELFLETLVPSVLVLAVNSTGPLPVPTIQGLTFAPAAIYPDGLDGAFCTVSGDIR